MSVYKAEKGGYPLVITDILPANSTELNGTYFKSSDYSLPVATASNYTLRCTGSTGDVNTLTVDLTVSVNNVGTFSGTLLQ
jgi:hypothetical protein